jgi:hypothetical protein
MNSGVALHACIHSSHLFFPGIGTWDASRDRVCIVEWNKYQSRHEPMQFVDVLSDVVKFSMSWTSSSYEELLSIVLIH